MTRICSDGLYPSIQMAHMSKSGSVSCNNSDSLEYFVYKLPAHSLDCQKQSRSGLCLKPPVLLSVNDISGESRNVRKGGAGVTQPSPAGGLGWCCKPPNGVRGRIPEANAFWQQSTENWLKIRSLEVDFLARLQGYILK